MNGIGQLFRALVIETVALALLFWLAFYQLLPHTSGSDTGPQPLVIRTAPERFQQAAHTIRSTQEQIEATARRCYETAFRVVRERPAFDETELLAAAERQETAPPMLGEWRPRSARTRRTSFAPLERAPFKAPLEMRR